MERRLSWLTVAVVVVPLVLLGVVPVLAEGNAPGAAPAPGSVTLDAEAAHQVAALGEQMQDYLTLNDDGTLALGEIDRDKVAVDDAYLQNFREALEYVNGAISEGLFEVDENFELVWADSGLEVAPGEDAPAKASPEWYTVPRSYGLYVYFSYRDVRQYLPHRGLSTALSLASYCGRPWTSVPFTYQFTHYLNYRYYYQYSYRTYGLWTYMPWSYLGYYSCCYQRSYRYLTYWNPYGSYWFYRLGYW
jgi:hypothetical protein